MTVVAEIGTAHGGSLDKACALIDAAAEAGADCVKFQWVYADEILHPDTGFVTLPGGAVRLYDRFRELEVDASFFASCRDYAREKGLLFACSPFGLRSLKELAALRPDAIKIASPEVNHIPLLEACALFYGTIPLILSSGVSRLGDIERAIDLLEGGQSAGQNAVALPPLTLLHCITSYPAPEREYNVRCVDTLRRVFGVPTGISDHSLDPVLIPVLTTAMGGVMIEKHITLSRK
ncbi:MAG: N-acetylneuraminate synthase family protein, partial [Treponema sp.]|nr:N-acetylneuraminate synthase family protein [Treponema sp.]